MRTPATTTTAEDLIALGEEYMDGKMDQRQFVLRLAALIIELKDQELIAEIAGAMADWER